MMQRRAVILQAIAMTALVVRDGRLGWAIVRVALVAIAATEARRRRGWFAVAVGIVGASSGAAIAVPYLAKDGPSVVAGAGVLAFATGATVLATAAAELLRASGWRGRVIGAVVGLGAAQLVVLPLVGAVAATNVPPTRLDDRTPADLGHQYEDVVLVADDGVHLGAWYIPASNGGAVVVLHGSGSTRSSVLEHGDVLADAGYGVLLLDARGHGTSGGDAMDFGWYGNRDVGAAIDFLDRRPDVAGGRIAALGLSMGGEQAITAAAADARIRAVVAEGATARVSGDGGFVPGGPTGWVRRAVERVMFTVADLLTSASPPATLRDAVAAVAPRPVLLIAGAPTDERRASRWLADAAPETTTVWSLRDTPHTRGLARHPSAWRETVIGFLDSAL